MSVECPYCKSSYSRKEGFYYTNKGKDKNQRYFCFKCEKKFSIPIESPEIGLPKILLFDIETSLMEVYVWGLYKQFISHNNIIKDKDGNEKTWFVISWAAKWLYDENVMSDIVTSREAKKRKDDRVLQSIWKLLDEADIVIGHNLDRFDIRKLNARFIDNDIKPPSPYRTIDTLKVARREFAFVSYKQDYLTKHFELQNKLETSFDLWVDCMKGDQKSLDLMESYNRHDVIGLEEVYLKIRPYMKNHPNLGVLMDADVCPNCGCEDLEELETFYFTTANKFPVYRCTGCKTPYIRHKKNVNSIQTNIRSVPK